MDNNSWYAESDWYEARTEDKKQEYSVPVRKRTGWRIFGIIIIIVAAIMATSIAFSRGGGNFELVWNNNGRQGGFSWGDEGKDIPSWFGGNDRNNGELPESAEDFFGSYYTETDTSTVTTQVNIPKFEGVLDFQLKLEELPEDKLSLGELYENCSGSVVAIYAYVDGQAGYYWGTGIVLSEEGLVLTNTHIIEGCDKATVKLSDNAEYEAKLVGADSVSDIALLKIECANLIPANFGNSGLMRVGDEVAAIGNPIGEEFRLTLTNGIISAINRGMNYKGRNMTLLQTDTALNSGNSGGALFNMYGQVIGVTNMKMMSNFNSIEGIGFAIPSSTLREVVNSLVRYGKVVGRPSIGITVGEIPQIAKEKYAMPDGVYVAGVQKNSDAAKKGVQEGDVITEVNYVPVATVDDINNIKNTLEVNDIMIFSIWRGGEKMDIEIILMDTNDIY